jgi:hypothetical protein
MFQDGLPGEWDERAAAQVKLAYAMAALEARERPHDAEVCRAFAAESQRPFDVAVLEAPGTEKCAAALGALASRKIILHIRDFSRLAGKEELAKEAAARLPGVYQRMVDDESVERRVMQNKFPALEKLASAKARAVASLGSEEYSLDKDAVYRRSALSALRGQPCPTLKTSFEKAAADGGEAEQLARDYAIYKIAALQQIAACDPNFMLTARMAIHQNYV